VRSSSLGSSLRIAVVLDRLQPELGGLETFTAGLIEYLIEAGHEIHVVAFSGDAPLPVTFHRIPWDDSPLERARRVDQKLSTIDVDVIYDTGSALKADVLHPHTGSRVFSLDQFVATHSWLRRLRLLLSPGLRRLRNDFDVLERAQFREAGCVIAISRLVQSLLQRLYRLNPRSIELVPNGADLTTFRGRIEPEIRRALRLRLGVDEGCLFTLVAHNFHLKGVGTVLDALESMEADRRRALHVVVVGNGDISSYSEMARDRRVTDSISFVGGMAREDVAEYYAIADVSLQPSHYDACSLAILEALASGLPVITTAMVGAADRIESGAHGLVLDVSGDHRALARAMSEMLAPSTRARMRQAVLNLRDSLDARIGLRRIEGLIRKAANARRSSKDATRVSGR